MATLSFPFFQAIDGNGAPLPGAMLWFYRTGTSTPQNTYTTSALTSANANPVVADANGRFGPIYLGTAYDYKVILTTSAGVAGSPAIATIDPLFAAGTSGRTAVNDVNYTATISDSTIAYTALSAARTVTLPAALTFTGGNTLLIVDESGSASSTATISVAPNGTDTINGLNTTQVVISSSNGSAMLESDGTSKWTLLRNNEGRRAVADAITTVTARDSLISYTSLSAARIVTLPAATAYPAGKRLVIADESGSASATLTISLAPNGTNKIGGSNTTQAVITYPYGTVELTSNGVDSWDFLSSKTTSGTWTPADGTAAALVFTSVAATWERIGNQIFAHFTLTYPATADGTQTLISGLPVTVPNVDRAQVPSIVRAIGGSTTITAVPIKNTTTFNLFTNNGAFGNNSAATLTFRGMIIYPVN